MTTFELDLSKSDSFIEGIQEIFKPPSVESSNNNKIAKGYMKSLYMSAFNDGNVKDSNSTDDYDNKIQNKPGNISWKKPKSNAHEYCDSCGTFEGERLVCDRCPSSFHLECLDPPIEIDEAPVGVWYCNRCTAIMKEEDKMSCVSSHSQDKNEGDICNSNSAANGGHRNSGSAKRSVHSTSSGSSEITTEMLTEEVPIKKRKKSESEATFKHLDALQNLQDVVKCINPKEFELPKSLIPGIRLPLTFKTNAEMKIKSVISLDNGIIPRPHVTCFECSRTCFYGALIQCDYCPLYFHLDCLDPPLVQLPSRVERWMCPNHIEQVVDNSGIIKTIRLSERMTAYEEINRRISNIDEVDLLINFGLGRGFRFGSKVKEILKEKPKIDVPDAIKRMYKHPIMDISNFDKKDVQVKFDLNDSQKQILKSIFQATRKQANIHDLDAIKLLHSALDSISDLVQSKKIDLISDLPPIVFSRSGAEKVKSRAFFIPLSKDQNSEVLSQPIRMIYRNFDIGSSTDNDCVVTGCRYVSARHASISYIDNHFCFELANYSRYGTVVDGLLYYNDVSEKAGHRRQLDPLLRDVRAFINGGNGGNGGGRKGASDCMRSQRDSDKPPGSCACNEYGYSNRGHNNCTDRGWEGTASLTFGSVVWIGCQQFLFAATANDETVAKVLSLSQEGSSETSPGGDSPPDPKVKPETDPLPGDDCQECPS